MIVLSGASYGTGDGGGDDDGAACGNGRIVTRFILAGS